MISIEVTLSVFYYFPEEHRKYWNASTFRNTKTKALFSHTVPFSQASLRNFLYDFHPLFQWMGEMDETCASGIALNLILTQFQFAGLTLFSYWGP